MAENKKATTKLNIYEKLVFMQQEAAKKQINKEGTGAYSNNFFSEEQTFGLWNKYNTFNLLLSFDVLTDSIQFVSAGKGTGVVGILEWKLTDGKEEITGRTPFGNVNPSGNYSFAIESAKTYARRNVIGELLLLTVNGDTDPESPGNVKDQIKAGITSKTGTMFQNDATIGVPITQQAAPYVATNTVEPQMDSFEQDYLNFLTSPSFQELIGASEEFKTLLQNCQQKHGEQVGFYPMEVKKEILAWRK